MITGGRTDGRRPLTRRQKTEEMQTKRRGNRDEEDRRNVRWEDERGGGIISRN